MPQPSNIRQTELKPEVKHLALALSVLDGEVKWSKGDPGVPFHGKRWSSQLLTPLFKAAALGQPCLSEQLPEMISNILSAGQPAGKLLLNRTDCSGDCPDLHCFLQCALGTAIRLGAGDEAGRCGAGAIYLHDPVHDELVMAASTGFPFAPSISIDRLRTDLYESSRVDEHPGIPSNQSEHDKIQLDANLSRQSYIAKVLGPRIGAASLRRHDWVRGELRGVYTNLPSREKRFDCNEFLIGIAYYRPGSGITGQLFHHEEGPKLERIRFVEGAGFLEDFRFALPSEWPDENALKRHILDELLHKRTVVYEARQEMASGRQVRAGVYEGLQFPDSRYIGPFLGTVLRFNGEHLGILKVEKHRFRNADNPPSDEPLNEELEKMRQMNPDMKWWQVPNLFDGHCTARFLVFAYALAGILYVLKHHVGVDMSEGWTKHWCDSNGKKNTRCSHKLVPEVCKLG